MAAWGYTKGEPYLETLAKDEGEFSRNIHYLLDTGKRHRVTIDAAHDTPELRAAIGNALAERRTGQGRKGRT